MNKYVKLAIGGILGAAAGYIYYHFWGCTNGCPLQSNWMVMTGYGLFAGIVIMLPGRKKKPSKNQDEQ